LPSRSPQFFGLRFRIDHQLASLFLSRLELLVTTSLDIGIGE
jgi:hypothetical protein